MNTNNLTVKCMILTALLSISFSSHAMSSATFYYLSTFVIPMAHGINNSNAVKGKRFIEVDDFFTVDQVLGDEGQDEPLEKPADNGFDLNAIFNLGSYNEDALKRAFLIPITVATGTRVVLGLPDSFIPGFLAKSPIRYGRGIFNSCVSILVINNYEAMKSLITTDPQMKKNIEDFKVNVGQAGLNAKSIVGGLVSVVKNAATTTQDNHDFEQWRNNNKFQQPSTITQKQLTDTTTQDHHDFEQWRNNNKFQQSSSITQKQLTDTTTQDHHDFEQWRNNNKFQQSSTITQKQLTEEEQTAIINAIRKDSNNNEDDTDEEK